MEENNLQKKQIKFNSEIVGIIAGVILPLVVMILFSLYKNGSEGMFEFFLNLFAYGVLTRLISLCALPNLLLFFIFLWTDRMRSARGVIMATLLYTLIVIIIQNT